MKTFCYDNHKNWVNGVRMLLFADLVLGSGPTQSTLTLLKESSKAGKGRSVAACMF
jgi:hypothetical protein